MGQSSSSHPDDPQPLTGSLEAAGISAWPALWTDMPTRGTGLHAQIQHEPSTRSCSIAEHIAVVLDKLNLHMKKQLQFKVKSMQLDAQTFSMRLRNQWR